MLWTGISILATERFSDAEQTCREALQIGRGLNDINLIAAGLSPISWCVLQQGRQREGFDLHQECIQAARGAGDPGILGIRLAETYEFTLEAQRESFEIATELDSQSKTLHALWGHCHALLAVGEPLAAAWAEGAALTLDQAANEAINWYQHHDAGSHNAANDKSA